jgi:hypothetical protein
MARLAVGSVDEIALRIGRPRVAHGFGGFDLGAGDDHFVAFDLGIGPDEFFVVASDGEAFECARSWLSGRYA